MEARERRFTPNAVLLCVHALDFLFDPLEVAERRVRGNQVEKHHGDCEDSGVDCRELNRHQEAGYHIRVLF